MRGRIFRTVALTPHPAAASLARTLSRKGRGGKRLPPRRRVSSNSIFKQPSVIGPCYLRRCGASSFLFPSPLKSEGAERRQTHRKSIRTAAERRAKPLGAGGVLWPSPVGARTVTHAPNGAPLRRFLASGPCFRARPQLCKQSHRSGGFPAFTSLPSSHRRQPHLVGADGDPWPPGDGLRGTSAGAAPAGAGSPRFRPR